MRSYVRRKVSGAVTTATVLAMVLVPATPALAQETESGAKPWHYWVAPILLVGGILVLVALGVGYWVRVMGGRTRR